MEAKKKNRISLAVQWLRLCASTAGGTGLIPGWGTKTPHALWHGQKQKQTNKTSEYNKKAADSQIQRTNKLLPVGRGKGGDIGVGD